MTTLSGKTAVAGLIGWPVAHSLSPLMHNRWLGEAGIDGIYVPLPVAPERIGEAVAGVRALGLKGVNVTVPHKQAVIPFLDRLEPAAERLQAVNTVFVHTDGALVGDNTDGTGFVRSLETAMPLSSLQKARVSLIGAGGAARAILDGLLQAGVGEIHLTNRTRTTAEALKAHYQQTYPQTTLVIHDWQARAVALAGTSLLINTTSLGMTGKEPLDLALDQLPADAVVSDIVYNPLETALLGAARARGNPIVEGLGMLIYQGQTSFERWFGARPTVTDAIFDLLKSRL